MATMRLFILISVIMTYGIQCFYFPQPYNVKMYHHQTLLMYGENDTEEYTNFNLQTTYDQEHDLDKDREKRSNKEPSHNAKTDLYEDESLYRGSLEYDKELKNSESYNYDYYAFKGEYYQDEKQNSNGINGSLYNEYNENGEQTVDIDFNKTRNQNTNINITMENYCSVVLLFRTRVIQCYLFGLSHKNQDIIHRSSWVIVFWIVLYIITASYLWCTRGWCCCCCPCACCHPRSVLYETKEFLSQNPPGVAKLHSQRKVFYDFSEYEVKCYEALEREVFNF